MSRDPYRSTVGDLPRTERWDRDRFYHEQDRDKLFEEDDHVYTRRASDRRSGRFEDDVVVRERRVLYDDEPRYRRPSSPSVSEIDRRVVIERERGYARSPSPTMRRPPTLLRRQSSLDTFDRKPARFYERGEYDPPARRDELRSPPRSPVLPLPRSRGLPPPRVYAERDYYDEIRVSDPDRYGDDGFRTYPERIREKEVIHTRRRNHSPGSKTSHTRSTRSSSRSSSSDSSSSRSSRGTTVKSEYPKKGKTRIPARLVSTRALIDLNYEFTVEGNVIVVQKALGQDNIDDLLKLSKDYKKSKPLPAPCRGMPETNLLCS
jgi:hypothetical protein